MVERNKLIKLLNDKQDYGIRVIKSQMDDRCNKHNYIHNDAITEYLIENGVIVPPCKVGDTVYILAGSWGKRYEADICDGFFINYKNELQVKVQNRKGNHGTYGIMGETVFLTREEAEQALRKEDEGK